ncbi:MAG: ABC transporter permease subunit, partial [Alphaproteobacteria bacterium]
LLPVLSYLSPVLVYMITGSVFIDIFFTTGGIGSDFISAAFTRDYSLLLGLTLIYGLLTFAFNIVLDLLYAWIDPQVRAKL